MLGLEGLRRLVAVAEAGAEELAANQLLVLSQMHVLRVGFVVREIGGVDIDEFDDEIRIGAGSGDEEFGLERTGDGDVFGERRGLVDEHVGAAAGLALIVGHVLARHAGIDCGGERHGLGGIAYVLVELASGGGRAETELAVGTEIERGGSGLAGRPGIVALPLVGSGFKDEALGSCGSGAPLR